MAIAETERLYLREFTPNDAEDFYLLNLDPDVLKYTGDQPFKNVEQATEFLKNYQHYKKYGFGRWAVITKKDHQFIGWCGLKYTETSNEIDIGFRFFKKNWNQGYATEAANASLKVGLKKYQITQIVGRADIKNKASISVLKKIGLVFNKTIDFEGNEGVLYKTP